MKNKINENERVGNGQENCPRFILPAAMSFRDPSMIFSTAGKSPIITGLAKGTYGLALTVTDNAGKTGQDTLELESCFISTAIHGSP